MTTRAVLADKVQRYWELTRLIAEARRLAAVLHDELVDAITETGAPIDVEGLPTLRLIDRRSGRVWDVKSLAEREPREFQRLLELGCLSVLDKLAEVQVQAGNLSGTHRRFGWDTSSQALVFDDRGGRSLRPTRWVLQGWPSGALFGEPAAVRCPPVRPRARVRLAALTETCHPSDESAGLRVRATPGRTGDSNAPRTA